MTQLDSSKPYCGMGNIENLNRYMEEAFADVIVVPNSWLPEAFHDNVRGGRTLKRLNEMCAKRDGETAHRLEKATKARNIEKMAAQVAHLENTGEMDFALDYSQNECDDIKQHRAECALVGGMISGGLIDADDLLED